MTPERLQTLLEKYLRNTASPQEEQELTQWYQAANEKEVPWPITHHSEPEELKARLLKQLQSTIRNSAPRQVIPFYRRRSWQAAAAVLLIAGAAAWFFAGRSATPPPVAVTQPAKNTVPISPGGNKATLTLADGSTIVLDTAGNTTLAQQGATRIIKLNNGQLAYKDAAPQTAGTILYNTIATPKGGQYEIILPDGSHVWLNAASHLRFPTAFTAAERKVQLTGEAYFEVAKDAQRPFRVYTTHGQQETGMVEVLGTHFNINNYPDEPKTKTTLLEGKVRITTLRQNSATQSPTALLPGMQAAFANEQGNTPGIEVYNVEAEEAVAWKNGLFHFNNADIKTVMRQLARWYNVEVVYEGPLSKEKFEGQIPRNSTLEEVFSILELSAVHFKVEGRKVIVMP